MANQPGNGSNSPFQATAGKAPPLPYVGAQKPVGPSGGGGAQSVGAGKAAPLPYVGAMKLPQAASSRVAEQTSGSTVAGGPYPLQTSPGSIRAAQQGMGSIGNSALPFRITNQGR